VAGQESTLLPREFALLEHLLAPQRAGWQTRTMLLEKRYGTSALTRMTNVCRNPHQPLRAKVDKPFDREPESRPCAVPGYISCYLGIDG